MVNEVVRRDRRGNILYPDRPELVHTPDERRIAFSYEVADFIEAGMRRDAAAVGKEAEGPLCPGCFMTTLLNAAMIMARRHNLSPEELGATLGHEFFEIAAKAKARRQIPRWMLKALGVPEDDWEIAKQLTLAVEQAPALPQPIKSLISS